MSSQSSAVSCRSEKRSKPGVTGALVLASSSSVPSRPANSFRNSPRRASSGSTTRRRGTTGMPAALARASITRELPGWEALIWSWTMSLPGPFRSAAGSTGVGSLSIERNFHWRPSPASNLSAFVCLPPPFSSTSSPPENVARSSTWTWIGVVQSVR